MERRVFIAVLLSFVVLYSYQTYFAPPPPASTAKPSASPATGTTGTPSTGVTPAAPAATSPVSVPPAEPAPKSLVGEEQAREIPLSDSRGEMIAGPENPFVDLEHLFEACARTRQIALRSQHRREFVQRRRHLGVLLRPKHLHVEL